MKELKDGWWNLPSVHEADSRCDVRVNGSGELGQLIASHPSYPETSVVMFKEGEYREVATSQLREVQSIDEWCQKRAVEAYERIFRTFRENEDDEERVDISTIRDAMIDAIARYAL